MLLVFGGLNPENMDDTHPPTQRPRTPFLSGRAHRALHMGAMVASVLCVFAGVVLLSESRIPDPLRRLDYDVTVAFVLAALPVSFYVVCGGHDFMPFDEDGGVSAALSPARVWGVYGLAFALMGAHTALVTYVPVYLLALAKALNSDPLHAASVLVIVFAAIAMAFDILGVVRAAFLVVQWKNARTVKKQ